MLMRQKIPGATMSAALTSSSIRAIPRVCIKVAVAAPKGGVGKSTLVRAMLASAAGAGISAVGINMDEQQTLTTWHQRRELIRAHRPEISKIDVLTKPIGEWRSALSAIASYTIAFFDTPPGHGQNAVAISNICEKVDLVLIPTGVTEDDLNEVIPFAQSVAGEKAAFVLMKANRRTKSFIAAQTMLNKAGRLCPIEVPTLEDIHQFHPSGMTAIDMLGANGSEQLTAVWDFVRREVRL